MYLRYHAQVHDCKKPAPIALSIDEIEEMMAAKKIDEGHKENVSTKSIETQAEN